MPAGRVTRILIRREPPASDGSNAARSASVSHSEPSTTGRVATRSLSHGHGPDVPSSDWAERFIERTSPDWSTTTTPCGSCAITSPVIASWRSRSSPRRAARSSCTARREASLLISAAVAKHAAPIRPATATPPPLSPVPSASSTSNTASPSSRRVAIAAKDAATRGLDRTAAPATAATISTPTPLRVPPAACISTVSRIRSVAIELSSCQRNHRRIAPTTASSTTDSVT